MLLATSAQAHPAGKWEVKVAPADCSLLRIVLGPSPALLVVRTVPGSDEYAVPMSGKDVPKRESLPGEARLRWRDDLRGVSDAGRQDGGWPRASGSWAQSGDARRLWHRTGSTPVGSHARLGCVRHSAREAVAALRKCVADHSSPGALIPVRSRRRAGDGAQAERTRLTEAQLLISQVPRAATSTICTGFRSRLTVRSTAASAKPLRPTGRPRR